MTFTREQRVGLFFAGGVVLFIAFIEATVGTGLFRRTYRLWAEFRDVQGLSTGAQVRVGGVKAGSVETVELQPGRVRVGLGIRNGIDVREDAIARLDFQALSGTRYVAIDLGSADAQALAPGSQMQSEEPAGISEMIDQMKGVATSVRALTDSLNENQDRLLTSVSVMLEDNQKALTATVQNLAGITEKIDSGQGTLGKLLTDPMLYDEAVAALAELRESFGDIKKVTNALANGDGTMARLLYDDEMYDEIRETVASLGVIAQDAEEITSQIRAGQGTLGRVLYEDGLYLEAEDTLRATGRAMQGLEDQAPISVLGTFIGTLF